MNNRKQKAALARIESALVRGADHYFQQEGFVNVATVPHIVNITGACENVDTLYNFDYHGKEAFLTQTGQTALELLTGDIEKVCCVIHSFRAESDVDGRHLTEFPLVEFEFQYTDDGFPQLLHHIEQTIVAMVGNVLNLEQETLQQLGVDCARLKKMKVPFARISYDEAIQLVGLSWGDDLKHEHEMMLTQHFAGPVFVTRYPEKIKFFNMQRNLENPLLVNSTDLLLPFSGEAVGAAVREHEYDLLLKKLKQSEMFRILSARGKTLEDFSTYLDEVKNNPTPHAGCGIGLPRVAQFVLGAADIRNAVVYPMNRDSL